MLRRGLNGSSVERRWSDGLAGDLGRGEREFGVVEFGWGDRRDGMMMGSLDGKMGSWGGGGRALTREDVRGDRGSGEDRKEWRGE